MSIRVFLADDHAIVRQGLRLLLTAQPGLHIVGEAADADVLAGAVPTAAPDVLLLDWFMPGTPPADALPPLLHAHPALRVLVLTSAVAANEVRAAFAAGAHGYLLKTSRPAELVRAVEAVHAGHTVVDPAVSAAVVHPLRHAHPLAVLTERERDVFAALARGQGSEEIARALVISEGTARTHIANVLDKLALRDRAQVVIFALKHGLTRVDDLP